MKISEMPRRFFVGALGAVVASSAVGAHSLGLRPVADPSATLARRLAALLPKRDSALVVGCVVRAEQRRFGRHTRFISRLNSSEKIDVQSLLQLSDDALRQHFSDQIRDDFRAGRVVEIDGWRLSETEAAVADLLCTVSPDRYEPV